MLYLNSISPGHWESFISGYTSYVSRMGGFRKVKARKRVSATVRSASSIASYSRIPLFRKVMPLLPFEKLTKRCIGNTGFGRPQYQLSGVRITCR
ncbi:MAG: hypothetical protein BWY06_03358 [Candidatus Latescibacteria bacterium ADurb.Bin168]|nr:MAG: hypothetical protein BWY06_03358 [Candidatus Latescibacteria bacterium ADurb.Bin168]